MKKQKTKNKKNVNINASESFSFLHELGKFLVYAFGGLLALTLLLFIYINLPVKENDIQAKVGVTFSQRYAQEINLDWKQAFLAMLDDLQIKHIRIPVYWDMVEPEEGQYNFQDLDWQLAEAAKRDAKIILVMGKKVPRWPECFVPQWLGGNNSPQVQKKLLKFERTIIERYKNGHPEIVNWQIENEPFLDFGICGTIDENMLDAEIAQTRILDQTRPIVVTDSGELSLWLKAAKRADIFGTTMYREVYSAKMGHWRYPIGPNFFKLKQLLIKVFAHQKNAIVIELQGEPWVAGWTTNAPIETQLASMNAEILADNVEFAKKTQMKEIYVWGVEWWYWMKTTQNNNTLWEAARKFNSQTMANN